MRRIARTVAPLLAIGATTGCLGSETVYPDSPSTGIRASKTPVPTAFQPPANATFLLDVGADGALGQAGRAKVAVDVARLHDGALGTAKGNPALGDQQAVDFPVFTVDARYPRAIVRVVNTSGRDQLSPGNADFRFGADFLIDRKSAGATADNGDNLVQRGLSSDPVMFKLEIDRDRPTCLVRGRDGVVVVRTADFIQPGWWYRADCHRTEDAVTLTLTEFAPDGSVTTTVTSSRGRTGPLDVVGTATPLSVGGKLARNGGPIESATDQFNGRAASAYLVIAR
ncbi:MAG TPA: hypothetical protein VFK52_07225 [Nocardioidaceae bacterium]|nr:hypothetical protein [Nocardioidaceae bacterium]